MVYMPLEVGPADFKEWLAWCDGRERELAAALGRPHHLGAERWYTRSEITAYCAEARARYPATSLSPETLSVLVEEGQIERDTSGRPWRYRFVEAVGSEGAEGE